MRAWTSGCGGSLRVALRVQVAAIGVTIGIARGGCSDAPKGVVSAVSWGYFAAAARLVEGRTASFKYGFCRIHLRSWFIGAPKWCAEVR